MKVYWFSLPRTVGGPLVRTQRMKNYFGESGFYHSNLIVGQSWFSPKSLLLFCLGGFFKKSVFIQNGFFSSENFYGRLRNRFLFAASFFSDVVVFQSDYCKSTYLKLFKTLPSSYRVIHNAAPPRKYLSVACDVFPPYNKNNFCVISGNLSVRSRIKDLSIFCHAWQRSVFSGLSLYIFDYPIRELEQFSFLNFMGKKTNDVVMAMVYQSQFVIHLKIDDPCPNAVSEAISVGKLVFAHNSGGTKELVDGSGYMFNVFKEDALINDLQNFQSIFCNGNFGKNKDLNLWDDFCNSYNDVFIL